MLPFLTIAVLVITTNAQSLAPEEDVKIRQKRLINADNTTIEKHPYQVAIELDNGYYCGGSIISKYYVLTAAHCVNFTIDTIKVRSGSSLRGEGGKLHDVSKTVLHQSYHLNAYLNSNFDVALVRVRQPFVYDSTRKRIELYKKVMTPVFMSNEKAIITAWGYVDSYDNFVSQLQIIAVPLVSKYLCHSMYRNFGGIYDGQICAGYRGSREPDTCQGDSGSPLTLGGKLIGVLAYAENECGLYNHPTVFTEVAYVLDWIKANAEFDNC